MPLNNEPQIEEIPQIFGILPWQIMYIREIFRDCSRNFMYLYPPLAIIFKAEPMRYWVAYVSSGIEFSNLLKPKRGAVFGPHLRFKRLDNSSNIIFDLDNIFGRPITPENAILWTNPDDETVYSAFYAVNFQILNPLLVRTALWRYGGDFTTENIELITQDGFYLSPSASDIDSDVDSLTYSDPDEGDSQ